MIDLDLFKRLNDTRGHSAGDQVLIRAGAEWSRQLRRGDLLSRVGGEEFGVLLPGADESTAMEIVERLRDACPWPMTCSAGVAVLHPDESAADVLERADRALYEAKDRGRDMTVLSRRPVRHPAASVSFAEARLFDEWPVIEQPVGDDPQPKDPGAGDGSISGEGSGTAPAG
jgi:predicted signal transduction protein with EAL and GGDEF domain